MTDIEINQKFHKLLENIIDIAYHDEPKENVEKYKKFKLNILTDNRKSCHGWCNTKTKLIVIFNVMDRESGQVFMTIIHELAHHIDGVKHGRSGHQKPFYEEYKRLAYTAIDLGIATKDDFSHSEDSRGHKKVEKFINEYTPYLQDHKLPVYQGEEKAAYIAAYGRVYRLRKTLAKKGFRYCISKRTWLKKANPDSAQAECDELISNMSEGSELTFKTYLV